MCGCVDVRVRVREPLKVTAVVTATKVTTGRSAGWAVVAWWLVVVVFFAAGALEEAKAGSNIAFESDRDGSHDIYVMNASDGSNVTRLTMNPSSGDYEPAWSPDGTQIAYRSSRGVNHEIYVMNAADGSNQTNLTNHFSSDSDPA